MCKIETLLLGLYCLMQTSGGAVDFQRSVTPAGGEVLAHDGHCNGMLVHSHGLIFRDRKYSMSGATLNPAIATNTGHVYKCGGCI